MISVYRQYELNHYSEIVSSTLEKRFHYCSAGIAGRHTDELDLRLDFPPFYSFSLRIFDLWTILFHHSLVYSATPLDKEEVLNSMD